MINSSKPIGITAAGFALAAGLANPSEGPAQISALGLNGSTVDKVTKMSLPSNGGAATVAVSLNSGSTTNYSVPYTGSLANTNAVKAAANDVLSRLNQSQVSLNVPHHFLASTNGLTNMTMMPKVAFVSNGDIVFAWENQNGDIVFADPLAFDGSPSSFQTTLAKSLGNVAPDSTVTVQGANFNPGDLTGSIITPTAVANLPASAPSRGQLLAAQSFDGGKTTAYPLSSTSPKELAEIQAAYEARPKQTAKFAF